MLARSGAGSHDAASGLELEVIAAVVIGGGSLRGGEGRVSGTLIGALLITILHLRRRFDLVQVNTMPDALVFAAVVPKLLGARVVLDLHECMPEFYAVKFAAGMRHPVVRLLAWFEQSAIRFSDVAITCTDQMRDAFCSRGAAKEKIEVPQR